MKTNFLFAMAVLAVVSGFALMIYAFGKNEKNKPSRAFLCALPSGVVLVRAIEIQFDGSIEMNDPLKISLQLASIALILGIIYTAKCEFDINETTPRMRLITLMFTPVMVLSFAIPTIVCYYARVNMIFTYLIDALLYLSLCGFVMFSYMPCAAAKPICDEKWVEYDRQVDLINGKVTTEESSDEESSDEEPSDEAETDFAETEEKKPEFLSEQTSPEETDEAEDDDDTKEDETENTEEL